MKWGRKVIGTFIAVGVIIGGIVFLFRSGTARIQNGNRLQAQVAAWSLATAADQFFTEYSKLPGVPGRVTTDSGEGIRLLNILMGNKPQDAAAENERFIRFLALREGRNNRGGVIYASTGSGSAVGLYDEWGNPFTVVLDTDGDEVLKFKLGSKKMRLEGRRVAVVSPGRDGKLGTSDDVKTW